MEGTSNVVLNMHAQQDFLAYCTRPVSVHLAMVCAGCSFNSFSVFLLGLKQQQNLIKIMFSCIHFPVWLYPPKIMKKMYFILVNYMGWQVCTQCYLPLCQLHFDFRDFSEYCWVIQAGLLTPLTFAQHRLSPLAAFTSGAVTVNLRILHCQL